MKIYLNGRFVSKDEAVISVFDHGFLYGDGAFEGIRSYRRRVFKLKEHIDRLFETAHTLMITPPLSREEAARAVLQTLTENGLDDAYIRVVLTRGEGDLGLDPQKCTGRPSLIIIADSIVLYPAEMYEKGMAIITVPTVRNHPEAINPQLKSLNYLNNILAKIEANVAGYPEAIMLDHRGMVAECTGDNIFILQRGELLTPRHGRLRGITRDAVMDLAGQEGIPVREADFTRHELYNAEECFLTGTAAEIIPVVKVDGRTIGSGLPGSVTKRLLTRFRELVASEGVPY